MRKLKLGWKINMNTNVMSIGMLASLVLAGSVQAQDCMAQIRSPKDASAFLKNRSVRMEQGCVILALQTLAAPQWFMHAPVVVEYLDFRVPKPAGVVVAHRLPSPGEEYPAIHTLMEMRIQRNRQ
jgi:hypothetical protein